MDLLPANRGANDSIAKSSRCQDPPIHYGAFVCRKKDHQVETRAQKVEPRLHINLYGTVLLH